MKMNKKWLCLLLTALLVLAVAAFAGAEEAAKPNFDVKDGIAIRYVGTETVVTKDMFKNEGVTVIGASCFKTSDVKITEIHIPDTVVSIQDSAFAECRYLTTVELSGKITSIPDNAFLNDTSLTGIVIKKGVVSIGANAFKNCISLAAVEGPDVVKPKAAVGSYRPVPATVTTVSDGAFDNCPMAVLSCFKGSAVETYAINHGVKYESLAPIIYSITPAQPEYTLIYDAASTNTAAISVTINPSIASASELAWSSSDPTVLEISQTGIATPKKQGAVTVTIASEDYGQNLFDVKAFVRIVVLDSSKGWQDVGGNRYYCTSASTYAIDWNKIGSAYYCFDSLGRMRRGWYTPAGTTNTYYLRPSDGAMIVGWFQVAGANTPWYYFNEDGILQRGWIKIDGQWYYTDPDTAQMVTGTRVINGVTYFFNDSGVLMDDGWKKIGDKWFYVTNSVLYRGWLKDSGSWYFMSRDDGHMVTGWLKDGGKWYYMHSNGIMAVGWIRDGSKRYYLGKDGAMATGWLKLNKSWYYLNKDGDMATGWKQIDGSWYYFRTDGTMVANKTITLDGVKYKFNKNGVWVK